MMDLFTMAEQRARPRIRPTAEKTLAVLETLESGHKLTVASALGMLGVYALSQECGRLRKLGWPIRDEWKKTANTKVKEYWL